MFDGLKSFLSRLFTPSKKMKLSQKALDLIIKYEVGGGKAYYDRYLKHPTWPRGASGVTIGVGYDLGYASLEQFTADWKSKLDYSDFQNLARCLGKKGTAAIEPTRTVKAISIPWEVALEVFESSTIPRYAKMTDGVFKGAKDLHPDAYGALVSLVFNRGASVEGSSRAEMRNIQSLVLKKDYKGIAKEIRAMKRLWIGKGLDGLLERRDAEAKLVENCA